MQCRPQITNCNLNPSNWEPAHGKMEIELSCDWVYRETGDLCLVERGRETSSDDVDGCLVSGLSCTYAT